MVNCLVTKLDADSNNPNLPIYGAIIVHIVQPSFKAYQPSRIWVGADGFELTEGGQWVDSSGNADENGTYLGTGTYDLIIYGRNNITRVNTPATAKQDYGSNKVLQYNIESYELCENIEGANHILGLGLTGNIANAFQNWVGAAKINLANSDGITGDLAVMFKRMVLNGRSANLILEATYQTKTDSIKFNGATYRSMGALNDYLSLIDSHTIGLYSSSNVLIASCDMNSIGD
jgi:hypothetical protein